MSSNCTNSSCRRLRLQTTAALLLCSAAAGQLKAQDDPVDQSQAAQAEAAPETSNKVGEASEHFERGVRFYEDGDYRAALLEFQRSYALEPAYQLLYNLGQVADELHDYAGAEGYFQRYLAESKGVIAADRRSDVLVTLSRLNARIGSLRISSNQPGAVIHVDDQKVEDPGQRPVRVSAGRHLVIADKPGFLPVQRYVDVLGREESSVVLTFGPALSDAREAAAKGGSHALPWVTGIASGALLIGGGAVGYWASRDAAAYSEALNRFTTQAELDQLASSTQTKALVADVLLGAGIAAAVTTVILVLVEGPSEAAPRAAADHMVWVPVRF
jgi:tetratricopeptide (TPR) repeat protein